MLIPFLCVNNTQTVEPVPKPVERTAEFVIELVAKTEQDVVKVSTASQ